MIRKWFHDRFFLQEIGPHVSSRFSWDFDLCKCIRQCPFSRWKSTQTADFIYMPNRLVCVCVCALFKNSRTQEHSHFKYIRFCDSAEEPFDSSAAHRNQQRIKCVFFSICINVLCSNDEHSLGMGHKQPKSRHDILKCAMVPFQNKYFNDMRFSMGFECQTTQSKVSNCYHSCVFKSIIIHSLLKRMTLRIQRCLEACVHNVLALCYITHRRSHGLPRWYERMSDDCMCSA